MKEHPSYFDTAIDIVLRNTPSRLKQDGYELPADDIDEDDEKTDTSLVATETSVKMQLGVDSSQDAVDAATENAKLNGLAEQDIICQR